MSLLARASGALEVVPAPPPTIAPVETDEFMSAMLTYLEPIVTCCKRLLGTVPVLFHRDEAPYLVKDLAANLGALSASMRGYVVGAYAGLLLTTLLLTTLNQVPQANQEPQAPGTPT